MQAPAIPEDEHERQAALDAYDIVDTLSEQEYDDLAFLASSICETPIALVSLVDQDRQWFKARVGLDATETGRDISFCGHVVANKRRCSWPTHPGRALRRQPAGDGRPRYPVLRRRPPRDA
jgi:hypothetical protein